MSGLWRVVLPGRCRPCRGGDTATRLPRRPRAVRAGVLLLLTTAASGLAVEPPPTVSPGSATGTAIDARCPTFSWGAVAGARAYELVVYRIGEEGEDPDPLLRESFAGAATSWTPASGSCLERGGRYAWSVRASAAEGTSEWSAPSLFDVAAIPDDWELEQALTVVRRYLGRPSEVPSPESDGPETRAPTIDGIVADGSRATPAPAGGPTALAVVSGDPSVQVNGSSVVTTATLGSGLCAALTYRYVDKGDGTVLDCTTGLVWLKDASCLGTGTWGSSSTNGTIQRAVAQLNLGTQFNCSGYTPGTYTDWQVPAMTAMCGLWNGSCTGAGCCSASQGLVNGAYTNPAVANAVGDGKWAAQDAFVSVHFASDGYWSATGASAGNAWGVLLGAGQVVAGPTATSGRVWAVRVGP